MSTPLLTLDQVTYRINHHLILDNITFQLPQKHILTLIGPNGAGKSTIIKLILGLIKPTQGHIKTLPKLNIGYVPQRLKIDHAIPLTVERFLKLNAIKQGLSIEEALNKVNALKLLQHDMTSLSGGEMQRILLAQAIIKKPQLLILDEPAQGIDIKGQVELYDLIVQLRDEFGCAVILVSHDLHLVAAKTDEVICLNKKMCCSGTPLHISDHPDFIQLFGPNAFKNIAFYEHKHSSKSPAASTPHITLPHLGATHD